MMHLVLSCWSNKDVPYLAVGIYGPWVIISHTNQKKICALSCPARSLALSYLETWEQCLAEDSEVGTPSTLKNMVLAI